MIGASLLLLVGVADASATEGDLLSRMAVPPRPAPTATAAPQMTKGERRPRAVRRIRRNDITETLRAMNMMQFGTDPTPMQRNNPNN